MTIRVLFAAGATLASACLCATSQAQTLPSLQNGSFEIPTFDGALPAGWDDFNIARYRGIGDGLLPAPVARTGTRSIEFPTGTDFVGYSTNAPLDPLDPNSEFNNPGYLFGIDKPDVTVSAWFYIPTTAPLICVNDPALRTRAGLKLEFRRTVNGSVYQSAEWLDIDPTNAAVATLFPGVVRITDGAGRPGIHTNNQWIQMSRTFNQNSGAFVDSATGQYYPLPPVNPNARVSVLPLRFGPPPIVAFSSGTVFFDDLTFTQASACIGDFNGSGSVTVQDIFDFLSAWFSSAPSADVNRSGSVTVQDIFDFLSAWFQGCS